MIWEGQAMTGGPHARANVTKTAITRFAGALVVLGAIFFLPAGTFNYWEGWVYIAVLFVPVIFVLLYLLKHDPALLERRMRTRETEAPQRLVILLSFVWFLLVFLIPGLDHRFGWSNMPAGVVIAADLLVLLGYLWVFLVFKENSYASRVVEVSQEQKVIRSGPYAIVRHPMYLGVIVMYVFTPLALGSYWAIIPAPLIIPILVIRILNEEELLLRELKGYGEYMQHTRYRLIPGVW
jgi:protein-S-isoprenylcysteine O-methyltransferase Ste14